jgi:hypothetical protein
VLDRCRPAGSDLSFSQDDTPWDIGYGWRAALADGRLMLLRGGVVTAYSLGTGRLLWQRTLMPAPARGAPWIGMNASVDVVTIKRGGARSRNVFLDTRTGAPLWSMDNDRGDFFLAGRHVIRMNGEAFEGYAPRTGRRLWRTAVTERDTTTFDEKVIYLNSVAQKGDDPRSPIQQHILRIDAATGRKLAALPLPGPLRVDMNATHGQPVPGMLVLDVLGNGKGPGVPITKTVALQTPTGRPLWTRKNDMAIDPGLFGQVDRKALTYTAVEPRTGRSRWTIPFGDNQPVMAHPGYLVTFQSDRADPIGKVQGLGPHGRLLWTSPPLERPDYLAGTPDTLLVITCTLWTGSEEAGLCADHRLTAVTLPG